MYVTPAQLADGAEMAKELAELYDVEPALLAAVVAGGDTSAWPPADVVAANDALASIARFCAQADAEVDARGLTPRGYPLPQSATQFPILTVWARACARYHVNRQRERTDENTFRIERDYRDTTRALDLLAAGKISLGAGDPLAPGPVDPADPNTGSVRIKSNPRMFTRDSLGDL